MELKELKQKKNNNKKSENEITEEIKLPKKSKNLIEESYYNKFTTIRSFCIFKNFLIFSAKTKKSLKNFNLETGKITLLKNDAHERPITNIRYYYSKKDDRDIILTISSSNCQIKLWEWEDNKLNNFYSNKVYNVDENKSFVYSSCFFNNGQNDYIIATNYNIKKENCESVKIIDFSNNTILLDSSNDNTYFVDIFNDNDNDKYYIITANNENLKSYDFETKNVYKIYNSSQKGIDYYCFCVMKIDNKLNLIASSNDGYLRLWDFDNGDIPLNEMNIGKGELYDICKWNDNSFFVGSENKQIIFVQLKSVNFEVVYTLEYDEKDIYQQICCIRKDDKEEPYLYTQSANDKIIKVWTY